LLFLDTQVENSVIALFAALPDQERSASKQLVAPLPYTQSQTALFDYKFGDRTKK
jgi:hypothetical protein